MVLPTSISSLLALSVLAFFSLSARASPHLPRTASSTAASTLKLAVRINSSGVKNIAAADRARAQTFSAEDGSNITSIDATNNGVTYTADVGVGSPATYYTLLIDTGSSNTWIGANKSYTKTTTSQDTGCRFGLAYGGPTDLTYVAGVEYSDTVTLTSDLVIENQSIGVASTYPDLGGLDGILGLGPVNLTQDTVCNGGEVPTVMDNLYAQRTIHSEVFGVFFAPASSDNSGGELTIGSFDNSKITGFINYASSTSTYPASRYWGIDQSISYGSTSILTKTAGIVDTGTTLILIATDAFRKYQSATGGTPDEATGLLKISLDQYNQLSSLYFTIGSDALELTPNGQIWPRSLNTAIGGTTDGIYLVVGDIGSNSGFGLDVIIGYCFLERYYSIFEKTSYSESVAFAATEYTYATSN
ncbi:acid protease [Suillus clintonianus]|uniref:acid protease n=1 Tax=Suillus clintonianus TaxID=1904413 RepID=UPI001B86C144|nr:acid protease [Suillus clintonianus]KAG2120233.1 acid protease [Suillus clintonianus]